MSYAHVPGVVERIGSGSGNFGSGFDVVELMVSWLGVTQACVCESRTNVTSNKGSVGMVDTL